MRPPAALPIFLALACTAGAATTPDLTPAGFAKAVTPLFEDHCYSCHGEGEHKGDLALDKLALDFSKPEKLRTWLSVIDKMDSGEMPPKKKARPAQAQLTAASSWLHAALYAADFR